jgi:hypothetical protein
LTRAEPRSIIGGYLSTTTMNEFTIAELAEIFKTVKESDEGKELNERQIKLRASILYKVNRKIALYNFFAKKSDTEANVPV